MIITINNQAIQSFSFGGVRGGLFFFLIACCTSAYAQSNIAKTPTTELYGYYQKGENVDEALFMAEQHEALMVKQGFTFTRTDKLSNSNYKVQWSKKYDAGFMEACIHYQFMIPFFKITIEKMQVTFTDGYVLNYLTDTSAAAKKQFNSLYDMFVLNLVRLIEPAKTLTKEQFSKALDHLDKIPEIKT